MATDVDQVVVAARGNVYVAPVGTTGPTNIATALNASFIDLGYLSEDGISEFSPGVETNPIPAWQSFYPIRRIVTDRSLTIGFTMLEWSDVTLKLAFGGGAVATVAGPPAVYTYTPPDPADIDYRAMVVQWIDGTKNYRLHLPRVMVTDVGSIPLKRSDAAGIPLTFAVDAVDGASPFSLVTDDPAFAA